MQEEAIMVENMPQVTINNKTCESCELGKHYRHPFPKNLASYLQARINPLRYLWSNEYTVIE